MKNNQRRGALYIRESTEEQDKGFSPQNQERMMRDYANRENIEIVLVYKDLISGTSASKRTDFQRMMEDAELKKFDIILVYHTSRFARNIKDARENKEHLREKLGIDVVSITQPFGDYRQPGAFLNEGVNELFDAHYSKQLSAWVRGACMEKRKQGFQLGHPPFGYYKKIVGSDPITQKSIYDKNWLVHEENAKVVVRIFEMYATGRYSLADIAQEINKQGSKTTSGNPFTYSSVKDILKNRTYLGFVYSPRRGYVEIPGKHTPIISEQLFEKVQEKTLERRGNYGRPLKQHRFYLLQGIVFCYSCRKHLKKDNDNPHTKLLPKMYCETNPLGKTEVHFYGCKFRREYKACDQKNIQCKIIDDQVCKYMEGFSLEGDIIQKTVEKMEARLHAGETPASEKIYKELKQKQARLDKMYLEFGTISDESYKEQTDELKAQMKPYIRHGGPTSKEQEIAMAKSETEKFLKDFPRFWKMLPPEEKREWILMCIRRVWVEGEKIVAIEPHDSFKDLFRGFKEVFGRAPLVTPLWIFENKKASD